MFSKPVVTHTQILRLLYDRRLNVNEIFRLTGLSYKHAVTESIRELERGGLVNRTRDKEHTQKEFISLTPLGRELSDIALNIERFKKWYIELSTWYDVMDDLPQNRDEGSFLKQNGWTTEEVDEYGSSMNNISLILSISNKVVIESIINRIALQMIKYSITDIARTIINELVVNVINFRVSKVLDTIQDYHILKNKNQVSKHELKYHHIAYQQLSDLDGFGHISPKIIQQNVTELCIALLLLLNPPREMVIDNLRSEKKSEWKYGRKLKDKEPKLLPPVSSYIIDAYQEYLKMSSYPNLALSTFSKPD